MTARDLVVNESRLRRALLAGDEEAFAAFFAEHYRRLYGFALVRLDHDADLAAELTQATLCRALERLDSFRGEAAMFSWLCTICRNLIHDHRRRSGRTVELLDEGPAVRAALAALAERDDPAVALQRLEAQRLVHAALDLLPAHYGDALEWRYLDDQPVGEIAARLGVSHKAAESLLVRARSALRAVLAALARPSAAEAAR
jgi:RNA polymerase sigma-70 factor (ECF subfamily)